MPQAMTCTFYSSVFRDRDEIHHNRESRRRVGQRLLRHQRPDAARVDVISMKRLIMSGYAIMSTSSVALRGELLLALDLLSAGGPPILYRIPMTSRSQADSMLVEREYPNLKRKPA